MQLLLKLLCLFIMFKYVKSIPLNHDFSCSYSCNLDSELNTDIFENWEDLSNWQPEIAATGGGNDEFQVYNLDPENIDLINNTLTIKPSFVKGDLRRNLDLYPNGCTNNWNNGCFNKGSMHYNHGSLHWVNNKPIPVGGHRTKPFQSVKLISKESFGYGKLEIDFKLPRGNFLWPAIWMLPEDPYPWPTGGEIDLMESMGQETNSSYDLNYKKVSAALHYGDIDNSLFNINYSPFYENLLNKKLNRSNLTHGWHTTTLIRSPHNLIIKVDNNEILNCDKMFKEAAKNIPDTNIYKKEVLNKGFYAGFRNYSLMMGQQISEKLYINAPYNAPYHNKFKLIINLAIGGNFFNDQSNINVNGGNNVNKKMWNNFDDGLVSASQFLKNIEHWYNWDDSKVDFNKLKNDVCTLSWEECIKDSNLCDAFKDCYYENEKHLAYEKPNISSKSHFKIGVIKFTPY